MAVLRDTKTGSEFALRGASMTIGRAADCDFPINDPHVSGRHALILRTGDAFYITDLGSSNGTQVNGKRITESTRLRHGDLIDLCGACFKFREEQSATTIHVPEFALRDAPSSKSSRPPVLKTLEVGEDARLEISPEAKLRAVLEMSRTLGTTLDLKELLQKILEGLFALFPGADRGFILLSDPPGGPLEPKAVRYRALGAHGRPSISRTIIDHVIQSGQAVLSADAGRDDRFEPSQSIRDHQIRSIMCVPMVAPSGPCLGVIQLDTRGVKDQFRQEDLDVLVSCSHQAARAVELARMHEVKRDLEAATQIQKSFLPEERPSVAGLSFFDYYASAQQVGGDYYDYIPLPGNRLAVALGDVAGKGIAAALLMARLSAAARFCLATEETLSAAVRQLNLAMTRACGDGRFVTFTVGVLDLSTYSVSWVNAGHIPPLVRRTDGTVETVGESRAGIPLGVLDRPYEETTLALEPGDTVVLCTDGVTESKNGKNDMFGMDRLTAVVKAPHANVEALGVAILAEVRRFASGRPPHDDLTMVCFGRDAT